MIVTTIDPDVEQPSTPPSLHFYQCSRYALAFWSFLGFFNSYAMRVNLSVALVAMVNSSTYAKNHTPGECDDGRELTNVTSTLEGSFYWPPDVQGLILGSFFYGYIFTQLPGGWLAETFNAKHVFGLGLLGTSIFTLFTPLAAQHSAWAFMAVRILEGLGEGVTYPAMHCLWSKWAPPLERSTLLTFTYAGANLGTVFALPLSGILCETSFGWPSVFYVFGGIGIFWYICWIIIVAESPGEHKRIHPDERIYIEKAISQTVMTTLSNPEVPWMSFLHSVPLWALTIGHIGYTWGLYTLLTNLPTYMSTVLHFDIKSNGLFSALPYLCCWIITICAGKFADLLQKHKFCSTGTTRKICQGTGSLVPAVALVAVAQSGCDYVYAMLFLCIATGFSGFCTAGYNCNHLDLAPKFAGTLLGITNTIATTSGIVSPYVVGYLTKDSKSMVQWQIVFYIAAAIYVFTAIVFIFFGSGTKQSWAEGKDSQYLSSSTVGSSSLELTTIKRF